MIDEEMVTLMTGFAVPAPVLELTLISLRELSQHYPATFGEIVTQARHPHFQLSTIHQKIACSRGLVIGHRMDPIVREIIVAIVDSEDVTVTAASSPTGALVTA